MGTLVSLDAYRSRVIVPEPELEGQVTEVLGMLIEGVASGAAVGDLYLVHGRGGQVFAEVVALRGKHAVLMPYGHIAGLHIGARLTPAGVASRVAVSRALRGRVIDALGRPLDGKPLPKTEARLPVYRSPLSPMERRAVMEHVGLGIRAMDAFVPVGQGQRLGIFAGPGVGKTMLLGTMARLAAADVVVLALVGERGREVGHFVHSVLGPEGMAKSVVVVATSDRPPPERVRAAFVATTIAEYFRDLGLSVLLFVDSLTRFCMAQREIGLAIGEPPATKGYPPSAFALMPRLLERAGPARDKGGVTGIYTVLVEGDDMSDPVADAARSLLDGHVVLSRRLAERGHYPAIDVLQSLSRLEGALLGAADLAAARRVRAWLTRLEDSRDLISVGAYRPGADAELDTALRQARRIEDFLVQDTSQRTPLAETKARLQQLVKETA
jgi:flagellum-specific ATP synthase